MSTRDKSTWLPGPVEIHDDGTKKPNRKILNLIGATVTDNPDNDSIDVEFKGGGLEPTVEVGAAVAYNANGTPSDKRKKVAHTGAYDVHDYGAKGDGSTNDWQKLLDTNNAINPDTSWLDQRGGKILLKDRADYKSNNALRLHSSITLQGASGSCSPFSTPGTRITFGDGPRGIGGQGIHLPGIRGSNRSWANGTVLKDLGIVPSLLVTSPSAFPYNTTINATNPLTPATNATYVQETRREFVYECIKTGKTPKRPWPLRQNNTQYDVGDHICSPNGHVYRVVEIKGTGTSGPSTPVYTAGIQTTRVFNGGTEMPFYYDELIWDGDWTDIGGGDYRAGTNGVLWEECGFWHEIGHLICKPFQDAHDPRQKWTPGQTYEWGDIVWVDSVGGGDPVGGGPSSLPTYAANNAVLFKVLNQGGLMVGGTAGSTRPTIGAIGTTVSDGGIEWTRVTNAAFWVPQPTAEVISAAGTYNSSWTGGEQLVIGRDAEINVTITFAAGDDASVTACIAKINASYPSDKPIVDHGGRKRDNRLRFRALKRESAGQVRIVSGTTGVLAKLGLTAGTTVGEDGPILLARFHGGIHAEYVHDLDNIQIYGGENDLYHCYADGAAPVSGNSNFSCLNRLSGTQGKGAFIRLRGGDCNSFTIVSPRVWSGYASQYAEANTAFADESLGGATWVGACSDNHYGYSAYRGVIPVYSELTRSYQNSSFGNGAKFFGGHYEGGRVYSISGGQVTGAAVVRTRRSNFVDFELGKGVFGETGHDRTDITVGSGFTTGDKRINVRTYIGGQDGSSTDPRLIALGFQAVEPNNGYESLPQGFVLSNWLRQPHSAGSLQSNWNGWHMWCAGPGVYGAWLTPFAVSGEKAPFWKDDSGNAGGRLWVGGTNGMFVGEMYGATIPWTVLRYRTGLPSAGVWKAGDSISNADPMAAGTMRGFAGARCVVAGDYAGTAPQWELDGWVNPACRAREKAFVTDGTTGANQVIDDGSSMPFPANSMLEIEIRVAFKVDGEANAGSAILAGTFYRNGSGDPVRVGTDDTPAPKLTAGLAGTTLDLFINTTTDLVEVRMTPGAAKVIKGSVIRIHTRRVD